MAATPFLQEAVNSPPCSCHRQDCPLHRVTRSGLAEGVHLDLTPCACMESRVKNIFHDSVEHTHGTGRIHEKARCTQQQWPL